MLNMLMGNLTNQLDQCDDFGADFNFSVVKSQNGEYSCGAHVKMCMDGTEYECEYETSGTDVTSTLLDLMTGLSIKTEEMQQEEECDGCCLGCDCYTDCFEDDEVSADDFITLLQEENDMLRAELDELKSKEMKKEYEFSCSDDWKKAYEDFYKVLKKVKWL